jgi:hypothetical protein
VRRREQRDEHVRLATVQRVIRGQSFEGKAPSHFPLFALVTAGRDTGGHEFETSAAAEHLRIHVAGMRSVGVANIRILLTDVTHGNRVSVLQGVDEAFDLPDVRILRDPNREASPYYQGICFKVRGVFQDEEFEVSDGGSTQWTARILADQRERLFISASGLEPMAARLTP